jgi:hypothetical protein
MGKHKRLSSMGRKALLLLEALGPMTATQLFDEGISGGLGHVWTVMHRLESRDLVERRGYVGRAVIWGIKIPVYSTEDVR